MTASWLEQLCTARSRLRDSPRERAQYLLHHGTMRAGLYAPADDDQEPHLQDELYLVLQGSASFTRGHDKVSVAAGSLIFVPARMAHRFEAPSSDFETLVIFWGPINGEGDHDHPPN